MQINSLLAKTFRNSRRCSGGVRWGALGPTYWSAVRRSALRGSWLPGRVGSVVGARASSSRGGEPRMNCKDRVDLYMLFLIGQ